MSPGRRLGASTVGNCAAGALPALAVSAFSSNNTQRQSPDVIERNEVRSAFRLLHPVLPSFICLYRQRGRAPLRDRLEEEGDEDRHGWESLDRRVRLAAPSKPPSQCSACTSQGLDAEAEEALPQETPVVCLEIISACFKRCSFLAEFQEH